MKIRQLNPLFIKEVRTLFRGKGFLIVLNSYLGLISLVLAAGAVMALGKYYTTNAWEMGRGIVLGLGVYQLLALGLIAPSLTAASMSLERDRDTFDVLMVMPLGLARIVFYKTLASMMFLVMLVMASLPLLAGGFVLGGVAPGEIAVVGLLTLMAIVASGALGLMFSSLFQRTIIAVPGACLTAGVLMAATAFWIYVNDLTLTIRYANPIIALFDHMNGARLGFYLVEVPVWLPTLALLGLGCLLCLTIAVEGFRFKFRRNYAATGAMLLLINASILVFALGEALFTMPEKLDAPAVFELTAHLVALTLLMAALDPLVSTRSSFFSRQTAGKWRRAASWLFRPGLGLTLSAWAALTIVWIASAVQGSALGESSTPWIAAPLLAGGLVLFYSALGRVVMYGRCWKRRYVGRVIVAVLFVCLVGLPHVISMIMHAGDNQATSQVLDVLLFMSPMTACESLAGDVLSPYPYLEQLLQGVEFYWATIVLYAAIAAILGGIALLLKRRQEKQAR